MIIRTDGAGLLLFRQPDHAALAERIMRRWLADGLPESPRRAEILAAIAAHDNGWREPDASPLVDDASGDLLDFVHAPLDVRQGVWPRGAERLADTPYRAALVAQHSIQIFDRFHDDPVWEPFFADMRRRRGDYLALSGESPATLAREYEFLRLGDLISLTFCTGWTDEHRFGRYRIRRHGDEISVVPDPFGGATVDFSIIAKRLPHVRYTAASARDAFNEAADILVHGSAIGCAA